MMEVVRRAGALRGLTLLLALCAGCNAAKQTRPYREPPPAGIKPTVIPYVDTDGFNELLESALTNQEPAIVIQTTNDKPNWDGRLNAWIAAWNMGGKVAPATGKVRAQAPFPSVV